MLEVRVYLNETHGDVLTALTGKLFADVPETAQILRYDQRTVRRAIEAGEIPAVRAGGRWRIPTAWLRAQAQIGAGDAAATG
jgi:excisionase family DNA binding protein